MALALSDAERRHFIARSSGQWYRHRTAGEVYSFGDKAKQRQVEGCESSPPHSMWPTSMSSRSRSSWPHSAQESLPVFERRFQDFQGKDKGDFSAHANRHALENHGVFFDQGLGRRKHTYYRWQHKSGSLVWDPPAENKDVFASIKQSDYTARQHGLAKPAEYRRYPRTLPVEQVATGPTKPGTSATEWFTDNVHKTPLAVLSRTQEPRLCRNTWRYATHRYNT